MKNWLIKQMLSSKKFWYTVVGILTTLLSERLNLDAGEIQNILLSISALVLGQGIADTKK
jgi:hypothetical protein